MLTSLNLDDQNFDDIVELIMSELPRLAPEWTDYNEHDPGITLLELFAWYKEMQQYHLNAVTDAILSKLLLLAGMRPLPESPASATVQLPEEVQSLPALTKLYAAADVVFELDADYSVSAKLTGADAVSELGERTDIRTYFNQPNLSAAPFAFNGSVSKLELTLENVTGSPIRLYFEIDDRCSVPRNPFTDAFQVPRIIEWSVNGVTFTPDTDETHALSQSGFVTFTPEKSAESLAVVLYLREKGCEEEVRLRNISARTVTAVQRRTYTEPLTFDVDGLPNLSLPLPVTDGYVLANELVLMVRKGSGYERWNYTDDLNSAASGEKVFTLDAKRENVLFGDGEYGAVVPKGESAVVIEKLPVSYLERGNIPAGTMRIDDTEFFAENSAASGGRNTETVRETARRLAKRLRSSNKCVSAEDYKRAALNTPGLRVSAAEVRVGFDPDAPTEKSTLPIVTISVLPANENGHGQPDSRFIDTVYRYLNSKRPIGVTVKVR